MSGKEQALLRWRELKRKLRSGEIKFEDYAKAKRKLKPMIRGSE